MPDYLHVVTTTDSAEHARALARSVVEGRLAACAQVIGPITSVYRWKAAVQTGAEWQVAMKTTGTRYPELEAQVRRLHTYEVPEIIAIPLRHGSADYLQWISIETA